MILGLDPGTTKSAIARYDAASGTAETWTFDNDGMLVWLKGYHRVTRDILVVEQIAAMGMAVGGEVFETCFWSGRFVEAWGGKWDRLKRIPIKAHLCGQAKAKDANVRRALMDLFGGDASIKKGGRLYGVKGDEWSALAVAVTWGDLHGYISADRD
jgi:hypothetical protein